MNDMLDAVTAKKEALSNLNKLKRKEYETNFNKILNEIEEAVKYGNLNITVLDGDLHPDVKTDLLGLGYQVTLNDERGVRKNRWTISWEGETLNDNNKTNNIPSNNEGDRSKPSSIDSKGGVESKSKRNRKTK